LREYIKHSKKILLKETDIVKEIEAAKRGLSNFKTTPLALKARASKQALDLFSDLGL
jgi:glutamine synthetase